MKEPQFYPLTIKSVVPETDSAVCITFNVPPILKDKFVFTHGQFLTLKATVNNEEVRRAYSICSGVADNTLRVAIKRVEGGKLSNYANDHFKAGDEVAVMPPQGNFTTEISSQQSKNYMCIAVGSGITPMLSIIKSVLACEPNSQVTLIYGNKQSNTMMFKKELCFLKNRYMQRMKWINIMSQEDQDSDLLSGRIDNKKGYQLQKLKLINISNTDEAFICGPESLMSEVSRGFRLEGLKDSQVHYELFTSSAEDSQRIMDKAKARVKSFGEQNTSNVTLTFDGRSIKFELATVGENILDAGIENGMELPYSCKAGVCSTCKARLVKGKVDMDISHGLEPHEVEAGYILTCQAHPISEEVGVDYDQR
uniref:2Fe-2S iron-sulfur cluster-binding protein n=1 Tax=Ningiella ruwaisensis TaxID=2364274 RepID=UPI00109FB33D|nr:2Fe-2S iron-sulfur cluster-binding protein [Ningiella ruwaisensis]